MVYLHNKQHNISMPSYTEASPSSIPGQEEECLYPISPQLLPTGSPYVQPHPLTSAQLNSILRPPAIPTNFQLGSPTNCSLASSLAFFHPSLLYPSTINSSGSQSPYGVQNLQNLQQQLRMHHHAQLQRLRHSTLPR